uniref:Uncharacterized protein n=1 Tax=Anopheles atroparvus TaxID=41427 RepID=A0A182JHQ3_ANOAO
MLALVSCELKRRSLGLLPSRPPPAGERICSGRLVCELKIHHQQHVHRSRLCCASRPLEIPALTDEPVAIGIASNVCQGTRVVYTQSDMRCLSKKEKGLGLNAAGGSRLQFI